MWKKFASTLILTNSKMVVLIKSLFKKTFPWQDGVVARMARARRRTSHNLLSPAAAKADGRREVEQWPDGKMGNELLSG